MESGNEFPHVSELIILKCLPDFSMGVHDKWPPPNHRLIDRCAIHYEELGLRFRGPRDAAASPGEDGQVSFLDFTFAVNDQFATQAQKRACVPIRQWQFHCFSGV